MRSMMRWVARVSTFVRSSGPWAPLVVGLSVAGIAVATYLTQLHYEGSQALCTGVGDCATVNDSAYATIGPVPVALLGLAGYGALLACGLVRWWRPRWSSPSVFAAFGLSLVGVAYSGYLTYIEVAVIDAICPWCVVSAVLMTAIFAVCGREAVREPDAS